MCCLTLLLPGRGGLELSAVVLLFTILLVAYASRRSTPGPVETSFRLLAVVYVVCTRCVRVVYAVCTRGVRGVYALCKRGVRGVYAVYKLLF